MVAGLIVTESPIVPSDCQKSSLHLDSLDLEGIIFGVSKEVCVFSVGRFRQPLTDLLIRYLSSTGLINC
jgi:hypothetical protein